jgi:hypothetical protein
MKNVEAHVLKNWQEREGVMMLIGAVIAGLLIVSLFFEMISSSPKTAKEVSRSNRPVK